MSTTSFATGQEAPGRQSGSDRRERLGRARAFLLETRIYVAGNRRSAGVLLAIILLGFVTAAGIGLHKWRTNEESDSVAKLVERSQSAATQLQSLLANATPALGVSVARAMEENLGLELALGIDGSAWALDRRGKVVDSTEGGKLGFPLEARQAVFSGTFGVSGLIEGEGGARSVRVGIPLEGHGGIAAVVATVPAGFLAATVDSAIDVAPFTPSGQAALIDSAGRPLASSGIGAHQGRLLARASRAESSGTIHLEGTQQLYSNAQVGASPWSVVLVAPREEVLATAGGPAGWMTWVVLGEFAVAAMLGILLLMRVLRDADRMDQTNAELSERSALAEHATEVKSNFISAMAHEMRTPLAAVSMFAEAMRADVDDPLSPTQRRRVADIASGTRHLLDLLDDTMDIARVEAGRLELRPERISVAATAIGVLDVMQPLALDRGIDLRLEADGKLGEVFLDPARVRQVMINFLSNALKFTPTAGRVLMRIERRGSDSFLIAVDDTGIGVAADEVDRLFGPDGPTAAPVHDQDATSGLGLAVTKRIVEVMGGEVGIESTAGQGSTFFAILPLVNAERRGGLDGGSAAIRTHENQPV